jgi:Uma2 family endonuclease
MTIATNPPLTLAAYLNYDDGTDTRCELVNGELIAMPPESDLNNQIVPFLFATFLQIGIPYYRLRMKAQIAVSGAQGTAREPPSHGAIGSGSGSIRRSNAMPDHPRYASTLAGS